MFNEKQIRKKIKNNYLAYIALWQFLEFILLLILIWIIEIKDLTSFFFETEQSVDFFKTWIVSMAVIICAIITVGNTYLQQKYIIRGFLIVCSSCKKIKIKQNVWEQIDFYLTKHSDAVLSHGLCPKCHKVFEDNIETST